MCRDSPARKGRFLFAFVLCVTAFPALAQDPVKTDPAFNQVEFENERVRILRIRLTMHELNRLQVGRPGSNHIEPGAQLGSIGMRAVAIDHLDGCSQWNLLSEYPKNRSLLHNPPPERMLSLKPHYQYGITGI